MSPFLTDQERDRFIIWLEDEAASGNALADHADFRCNGRKNCIEDKPAAHAAREYLKELIGKSPLDCQTMDYDTKWHRIVAKCSVRGIDIGCQMVKAGHGRPYMNKRFGNGLYAPCRPSP